MYRIYQYNYIRYIEVKLLIKMKNIKKIPNTHFKLNRA